RFGRAAAEMAQHGESHLDEIISSSSLLKKRAEKNKQEDKRGGYTQRDTKHAFRGQPVLRRGTGDRRAPVGQKIGKIGTEKGVAQKQDAHDGQGEAQGAAR